MPSAPALVAGVSRAAWLTPDGRAARAAPRRGGGAGPQHAADPGPRPGDGAAAGYRAVRGARSAGAVRLRAAGAVLPADAARHRRGDGCRARRRPGQRRIGAVLGDAAAAGRACRRRRRRQRHAHAAGRPRADHDPRRLALGSCRPRRPRRRARGVSARPCDDVAPCLERARRMGRFRAVDPRRELAGRTGRGARPADQDARQEMPSRGRSRPTMPPPPAPRSRRATNRTRRAWCWPRPAPASARRWAISRRRRVWAEKNGGPVWISTYTRNLQHQIDRELDRPVSRPGRQGAPGRDPQGPRELSLPAEPTRRRWRRCRRRPQDAVALGLMARWAGATRDGDMVGGDFPAWLADLVGRVRTRGLADRRGECIYSACRTITKCFVEKTIRRARRADIVIANHALVMIQAALGGVDDANMPTRYVFDEGHHVFDAADSAFSGHPVGRRDARAAALAAGRAKAAASRARGLKRALRRPDRRRRPGRGSARSRRCATARALPGDGWLSRLAGDIRVGPTEAFLRWCAGRCWRAPTMPTTATASRRTRAPPVPGLVEAAQALDAALARLIEPIALLSKRLADELEDEADDLDTATRIRIEALVRSLARRGARQARRLARHAAAPWRATTPPEFVDWFVGRPASTAARSMSACTATGSTRPCRSPHRWSQPAHGVLVTSATLTDGTGDADSDWRAAEVRTGARHLPELRARERALALRLSEADARAGGERRRGSDIGPARRRLSRAVPRRGRRSAGPVHRDQPAQGRPRAHRQPPGAKKVCRSMPSMSTGSTPAR